MGDSAADKPKLAKWTPPPPTTEDLDWAPLATIDLSRFDEPGGKEALAKELATAVREWGFWAIVGTGIPQDQIDRGFAIGNAFFKLSVEEKRKIASDQEHGGIFGYVENKKQIGKGNVIENFEMLNIPKYTPHYDNVPKLDFLEAFRDELAPLHKLIWEKAIKKLYTLFAIILELPENWFVERHSYEDPSEDFIRFLQYRPRPAEIDAQFGNVWTFGHTDYGSLTVLFSQNVAGLQVRTPNDKEWKWVRPVEGGLTCNAGDTLSFLSKGYIKSTVHRVMRPPKDQENYERIAFGYFSRPTDDLPLKPAPSPVLRREGFLTEEDERANPQDVVKGSEYVRARVKLEHDQRQSKDKDYDPVFKLGNLAIQDVY